MNTPKYQVIRFTRPIKVATFFKTYDVTVGRDYLAEIDPTSLVVTVHDEMFAGGKATVRAQWAVDYVVDASRTGVT